MLYKDEFKKIMDMQTEDMNKNLIKESETAMCELNLMLNSGYITEEQYFKVKTHVQIKDKENICGFNLYQGQREAAGFQEFTSNGTESVYGQHPCDIFRETSVEVLHGRYMPPDATVDIAYVRDRHGIAKVIKNENRLQRKLPDNDVTDMYIPWTHQIIICKVAIDLWVANSTTGSGGYADPLKLDTVHKIMMYVPHNRGERLDMETVLKEKGANK